MGMDGFTTTVAIWWVPLNCGGANSAESNMLKAWVSFSADGTILSSYNVEAVTRQNPGCYTVEFINAMANTNYAVVTGGFNQRDGTGYAAVDGNLGGKSKENCKIVTGTTPGTVMDNKETYLLFYNN